MLVLSRSLGERLVIGGNIEITLVQIAGGRVRLGINAPRDVPVYREEVARRIAGERDDRRQQVSVKAHG